MENFVFYNPTKIIFGKNTISTMGREIQKSGLKRILLLAGSGSIKKNGVYKEVIDSLNKFGIEFEEIWGVRPNPILSHALEAIEIVRTKNIDAVLAVGGGSVIDEAKAVAAGFYLDNLWAAYEWKVPIERALPIFTVLTLSGTCSEMDSYAVLTNESEMKKWNIGSPYIFPKVSIIDPSVQMSLPWHQTVNGAIDAMSHVMENYFLGTNQEVTLALDESLLRTIIKNLDALQIDNFDYNNRASLAWSATMGLNGNTVVGLGGGDWGSHRIEHGISALFPEIAHGAGLAVVFPAWIKYLSGFFPGHFNRWASEVWSAATVEEAVIKMKQKYSSWKAPVTLRELGIKEEDIERITDNSMRIGQIGVLKNLSRDEIIEILKLAY